MYEAARADGCSHEDADRRVAEQLDRWRVESRRVAAPIASPGWSVAPPPAVSSSRFTGLAQDVRYAARLLRRQPRHALLAILTMALGIGATTVLFSVAYGVLMKPLPWPHADRIVGNRGNARRQRAAVRRLHQRRLSRLARGGRDNRAHRGVVPASRHAHRGGRAGTHPDHRRNGQPLSAARCASARRIVLRAERRNVAGDRSVGGPVAAALQRGPRRSRQVRPSRRCALHRRRRAAGQPRVPDRQTRAIIPYRGSTDGRQLPVDVQRDRGASSRRDRSAGGRGRHGAGPLRRRYRHDDDGDFRQQRSDRDHRAADARRVDRRRPPPARSCCWWRSACCSPRRPRTSRACSSRARRRGAAKWRFAPRSAPAARA